MAKIIKKIELNTPVNTSLQIDVKKGLPENPFTQNEYELQVRDQRWSGGWVEGYGYIPTVGIILPTVEIYGSILSMRYAILGIAQHYLDLGVSESTHSDLIASWLSAVNEAPTSPWCAAFVSAVYREAGVPGPNTASAKNCESWGVEATNPKIGDVAIYMSSHSGIVSKVEGYRITTISGNWSDKVCEYTFNKSQLVIRTFEGMDF